MARGPLAHVTGIGGDEAGDARKPRVRYNPKGVGRALAAKIFPKPRRGFNVWRIDERLPLPLLHGGPTRAAPTRSARKR